jgi:hypothetical protein
MQEAVVRTSSVETKTEVTKCNIVICLFNDAANLDSLESGDNESEIMWKVAVVGEYNVPNHHLSWEIEENRENVRIFSIPVKILTGHLPRMSKLLPL